MYFYMISLQSHHVNSSPLKAEREVRKYLGTGSRTLLFLKVQIDVICNYKYHHHQQQQQ